MDFEAVAMPGWELQENANEMNPYEVPISSQDSGLFSDDESRETVYLSSDSEDLFSSLEDLPMSPEGAMSRGSRNSSTEEKENDETTRNLSRSELCDNSQANRSFCTENLTQDTQVTREPFQNIGLHRHSSLENTLIQLNLDEHNFARSDTSANNYMIIQGKDRQPKNSMLVCKNEDRQAYWTKFPIQVLDSKMEKFIGSKNIKPTYGQEESSGSIQIEENNQLEPCNKRDAQPCEEDQTRRTWSSSPVENTEPPKLVRLKSLSPGEKFRQIQLPVRSTFRSQAFLSRSDANDKIKRGFKRCLSPDLLEATPRQKMKRSFGIERLPERTVEIATIANAVFKVPEYFPMKKVSQKSVAGTSQLNNSRSRCASSQGTDTSSKEISQSDITKRQSKCECADFESEFKKPRRIQ